MGVRSDGDESVNRDEVMNSDILSRSGAGPMSVDGASSEGGQH